MKEWKPKKILRGLYVWKWGFGFNEGGFKYKYLPETQINHPNFYFIFGWWIGIKKSNHLKGK